MSKICIFQTGTADGVAAAWTIWKRRLGFYFYPSSKESTPPWNVLNKSTDLVIVGFTYPINIIIKLVNTCKSVKIFCKDDSKELKGLVSDNVVGGIIHLDMATCKVTWAEYNKGQECPFLLDAIDRKLDKRLLAVLDSYPRSPKSDSKTDIDSLLGTWDWMMLPAGLDKLLREADTIYRYRQQLILDGKLTEED